MGRPKKNKVNQPKGPAPEEHKKFDTVPAQDSPEYIDYIKSISVSTTPKPVHEKSYGELLADANKAHVDRTDKIRKEIADKAKAIAEGKTIKK